MPDFCGSKVRLVGTRAAPALTEFFERHLLHLEAPATPVIEVGAHSPNEHRLLVGTVRQQADEIAIELDVGEDPAASS